MNVAVVGATGQLGAEAVRAAREQGWGVTVLSHDDVEVTDPKSVRAALEGAGADLVVNTAAFHRVDACEEVPGRAFEVNAVGALHVARACQALGARCVHISTDFVFDGEKGRSYSEEDPPNPINVYGSSKWAGEQLVRQACPDAVIARVASLYGGRGARGKGSNFVLTVLERARRGEPLRVVNDIRMSPTHAGDAAAALVALVERGATGIYHVVNEGSCTWYEFASRAVELAGLDVPVEPTSHLAYQTRARRPTNSVLSAAKLNGMGIRTRPWQVALAEYVRAAVEAPGRP